LRRALLLKRFSPVFGLTSEHEDVGVNDDFFALGGHSCYCAARRAHSRRFQLDLPLRDLFEGPTVAAILGEDRSHAAHSESFEDVPLISVSRAGAFTAFFCSGTSVVLDQLEPHKRSLQHSTVLRLTGTLDHTFDATES